MYWTINACVKTLSTSTKKGKRKDTKALRINRFEIPLIIFEHEIYQEFLLRYARLF